MPRDTNGNYTLPSGNPVATATVITSTWANDTMSDLGNEMQDSLSRSGKGGFTAPVGIVDKSGSVPGLNFIAEPTSGLKREGSEDIRLQVTTTDIWQGIKTGVKVLTPGSGGVLKHPVVEESGQKVMRGVGGTTVMFFYNATTPLGWTVEQVDTSQLYLGVAPVGVGIPGVSGTDDLGLFEQILNISTTITGSSAGAEAPHTHTYSGTTGNANSGAYNLGPGAIPGVPPQHGHGFSGTTSAASDTTHSHGAGTLAGSDSQTVSFDPKRAVGILGKLDA